MKRKVFLFCMHGAPTTFAASDRPTRRIDKGEWLLHTIPHEPDVCEAGATSSISSRRNHIALGECLSGCPLLFRLKILVTFASRANKLTGDRCSRKNLHVP